MFRRPVPLTLLLVLAVVTAACGNDNDSTTQAAGENASEAGAAAFPVTVEHKFGATEIEDAPQRIVSIGYQEHDVLYALGAKPAAITGNPVVAGLQAMKEGRAVYMEGEMEAAFAFNSLLSLGFVLDEVVPLLEAATDGDPATEA